MSVKLRILLSISILTILGAVFIVGGMANDIHHNPEYTAQSSATYTESGVFFMENWNGIGRTYRLNDSGDVLDMTDSRAVDMDKAEKLYFSDGKLYALYSSLFSDKDGSYRVFRVARYDEELDPVSISPKFYIENGWRISSITADQDCIYITRIDEKGDGVSVDSIPAQSMYGIEEMDDKKVDSKANGSDDEITRDDYAVPDAVLHRERTSQRFYVEAYYADYELYTLLDGDAPEGNFAPDARVKAAVDSIRFTFGQKLRLNAPLIIKVFGVVAIWLVLVILTLKFSKDRDRIVYLYSASEVVFFLILLVAFLFIERQFVKNVVKNNLRFAVMVMQEDLKYYSDVDYDDDSFYDSTKYYRLLESLTDVVDKNDTDEVFYDVFVMRTSTGVILADARGRNAVHASYLYGGEISSLLEDLRADPEVSSVDLVIDGDKLIAVGYVSDNPADDLSLIAVVKDKKSAESYRASVVGLAILFIVVFIIGSILLFIVLYLQHSDLKRFSYALKGLALGKPKEDSPAEVSRDMRALWQSYGEISKRIEQINYDKYMIFEAYYRFAPKGIEEIMGMDSILDVKNGDVVTVSGSVVLLSIDEDEAFEKKVQSLSHILENIEKHAKKNEGFLVSRDPSLTNIRFLLLKEAGDTVSQIVQALHVGKLMKVQNNSMSILMYKDRLTYGVAGSTTQSLTYIDSAISKEMDMYASWFRKLGVPVVVTESIVLTDDVGEHRYVGTIWFRESGRAVRFYEVLDAYTAKNRQLMLINREKFESTLELFYSKDFYLARNQFMEILRDCPEDGIVKWYIFECERYMNGEADLSQSGYIQIDR